jgi:hypothetical protein
MINGTAPGRKFRIIRETGFFTKRSEAKYLSRTIPIAQRIGTDSGFFRFEDSKLHITNYRQINS